MRKFGIPIIILILLAVGQALTGCATAHRKINVSAPEQSTFVLNPGAGDAYLFDVKINDHGRKRSTRLDVYVKPDTMAMFARAYLGKGALKALITKDQSLVYFPTENEYFRGQLSDFVDKDCIRNMELERILIDLFFQRPVEFDFDSTNFYVVIEHESRELCRYKLVSKMCEKSLEVEYELRDGRYVPVFLGFAANDGSIRIDAKRRTQSLNIDIPQEKFSLSIPVDAAAIEP